MQAGTAFGTFGLMSGYLNNTLSIEYVDKIIKRYFMCKYFFELVLFKSVGGYLTTEFTEVTRRFAESFAY